MELQIFAIIFLFRLSIIDYRLYFLNNVFERLDYFLY